MHRIGELATRMAAEGGGQPAALGRLQLIDLNRIAARLGTRWERNRERIASALERALAPHLGLGGFVQRLGSTMLVAMLDRLTPREAPIVTALVVQGTLARLFGEEAAAQDLDVRTVIGMEDGKPVTQAFDPAAVFENWSPAVVPAQAQPIAGALPPLHFKFRPMLDVRRQVISTFFCTPQFEGQQLPTIDYSLLPGGASSSLVAPLDIATLRRALDELRRLTLMGRRSLVALRLHVRSLERAADRQEILRLLDGRPEARRQLTIELVGLPIEVPQSRMVRALSVLPARCRTVSFRVRLDEPRLRPLQAFGVRVLSASLSGSTLSEAATGRAVTRFAAEAHRLGHLCSVHGLATRSLAALTIAAGVDFVDGDAIDHPSAEVEAMTRFRLDDLFR